jgi:hypothetical protein
MPFQKFKISQLISYIYESNNHIEFYDVFKILGKDTPTVDEMAY